MNAHYLKYGRASYERHRAKVLEESRERHLRQRGLRNAQMRSWYERNKEAQRARSNARNNRLRDARANDPAYKKHRKQVVKKYYDLNRDVWLHSGQKRRALKKKASVNLAGIKAFFKLVRKSKQATCYYCGTTMHGSKVHFDHIIPLSKGGMHSADNLCVSCPTCNLSKYDKSVSAWLKCGQQLLSL